jgi:hypothetical protein
MMRAVGDTANPSETVNGMPGVNLMLTNVITQRPLARTLPKHREDPTLRPRGHAAPR